MRTLSASDIALLKASLLDGEAALAAFRTWRALTNFEGNHEGGQFRMFPLLHANMARLGLEDPVMGRLRGLHRHGWAEGQRRRHSAAAVVSLLNTAGIPAMVTKGLALAQDYYPDRALRPMADIDIVVPQDLALAALNVLQVSGWHPALSRGPITMASSMARLHSSSLKDSQGNEADLHWRPFQEAIHPELTVWFWHSAEPLDLGGAIASRPLPTPLLLHVITHGLRPNSLSPLRWVADAYMIMRHSGDQVDWHMLWSMARLARVEMRLADGLVTLGAITGHPMPATATRNPTWSLTEGLERISFTQQDRNAKWRPRHVFAALVLIMRVWLAGTKAQIPLIAIDLINQAVRKLLARKMKSAA
jgi:hypothetical protein